MSDDAPTIDAVLAAVTPKVARARVCVRGDLADEHAQLEAELLAAIKSDADTNEPDKAPDVARRIQAIESSMREATVEFVFEATGRKAWTDLLAEHPPSDEDRAQGLDFDAATFPPAAIAASCVAPSGITPEKADLLADKLSAGDWSALWDACLTANVIRGRLGESLAASVVLNGSQPSSEPPSTSDGLAASS